MEDHRDILYRVEDHIAWITIDRPERLNAFTSKTVDDLLDGFTRAWAELDVGVVVLTGSGTRAFCVGGDQKQRAESGDYGPSSSGLFRLEALHRMIRDIPKPVIAAVNGAAIGGGHVLHVLCDLSIASSTAVFGQAGPRVGSFDAGFGSAYLARVVGEKRAREIWFLCRQYSAQEALAMGLVNAVVEPDRLEEEVTAWAGEIVEKSPTALRFLKHSFNADTDHIAGIGQLSMAGLELFKTTHEAEEGLRSFIERRPPRFGRSKLGDA